jgi:hypothetical protein
MLRSQSRILVPCSLIAVPCSSLPIYWKGKVFDERSATLRFRRTGPARAGHGRSRDCPLQYSTGFIPDGNAESEPRRVCRRPAPAPISGSAAANRLPLQPRSAALLRTSRGSPDSFGGSATANCRPIFFQRRAALSAGRARRWPLVPTDSTSSFRACSQIATRLGLGTGLRAGAAPARRTVTLRCKRPEPGHRLSARQRVHPFDSTQLCRYAKIRFSARL